MCSTGSVAICGSRSLPSSASALVTQVTQSLLSANRSISVGCATGADQAVIYACIAHGPLFSLSIYAIGGQCGSGFAGSVSALNTVNQAASSGASVHWWSGGNQSVPVRQRLVSRSLACAGSAQSLVGFVTLPPSQTWSGSGLWRSCGSGTWSTVAAANARGIPVVVFPVGAWFPLPHLPVPGTWVVAGNGIWSKAFRFVPAQSNLI